GVRAARARGLFDGGGRGDPERVDVGREGARPRRPAAYRTPPQTRSRAGGDAGTGGRPIVTELRCADVEARFVDVADGRLDPADSVRFHAHIEGCAACRERAALWRGLVPRLRDAQPPGPDAMATRRMQVEIERRLAVAVAASPAGRRRVCGPRACGP